jgi:hypothetical protein
MKAAILLIIMSLFLAVSRPPILPCSTSIKARFFNGKKQKQKVFRSDKGLIWLNWKDPINIVGFGLVDSIVIEIDTEPVSPVNKQK